MRITENLNKELVEALKSIYPIRDKIKKTLMETHDESLLDKLNALNKIIKNAEILINKTEDVKKFYAENYPEYVDKISNVNERGVRRISILKKKWKTLGYLRKNA